MSVVEAAWAWARLGLSGQVHVAPPAWAYWHARVMVLAWSVILPLGMLVARFFKLWPGQSWPAVLDNRTWWRCHVGLQSFGVGLMSLGVALAFAHASASSGLALWHHRVGWVVVSIGWLQVAAGLGRGSKGGPTMPDRRGDHYDMTLRRRLFERVHKSLGWVALLLVVVVTSIGLVMLDAPRWMALAIGLWWAILAAAFVALQASGRCLDTYQAIWGADPVHPGNRRAPIGWGVRRRPHEGGAADEA